VVRSVKRGEGIENVLRKIGLNESTWEDAKEKYQRLAGRAIEREKGLCFRWHRVGVLAAKCVLAHLWDERFRHVPFVALLMTLP
jgi:protein-disulfide isomerase-like protein with CxxC motif